MSLLYYLDFTMHIVHVNTLVIPILVILKERPTNDFYPWGAKIWRSAWPVTPSPAHLCAQEKEEQRQRWCDRWISATSPSTSWLGSWGDLTWKKKYSEEHILHMKKAFFRAIKLMWQCHICIFVESAEGWLIQSLCIHLHECVDGNIKDTLTVHGWKYHFSFLFRIVYNLF